MRMTKITKEEAEKLVAEKVQQISESEFVVDYYEMLTILDKIFDDEVIVKDSFNNITGSIIEL